MSVFRFIIIAIFLLGNSVNGQTVNSVVTKSYQEFKKHRSVHYTAEFKMKFFSDKDTLHFNGTCDLDKVPMDSFFGGNVKISLADSGYVISDTKNIFEVNKKRKKITKYSLEKGENWAIISNMNGKMIWKFFLQPNGIADLISQSSSSEIHDTIIKDHVFYSIDIKQPDNGDFTNRKTTILFNEKYLPVRIDGVVKFQDNYQYTSLNITSYTFDAVDKNIFSIKDLAHKYKIDSYLAKEERTALDTGTLSPIIIGKNYTHSNADTVIYSGKITLLDFWYTSCYPCIRAIPGIEKLATDFGTHRFQIIGVNYYDNKKDTTRLSDFIQRNHITYPIFLVEKKTIDQFGISIWPTFMLINEKGEIIFSQEGYSENLYNTLNIKIHDALGK